MSSALRRGGRALLLARAQAHHLQQQPQQHLLASSLPAGRLNNRGFFSSAAPQQSRPPPTAADSDAADARPLPDLNDPSAAFATRTTPELLRAYLVLRLCMVKPLVRNAESLLSLSRRFLGDGLTDALVGRTFFAHFCAGVDGDAIQPAIARLRAANVQAIVDYAAEDDVDPASAAPPADDAAAAAAAANAAAASVAPSVPSSPSPSSPSSSSSSYVHPRGEGVVGRTYDYADEAACDAHVATFLSAIDAVGRERDGRGDGGFAAIKVTALGNPLLLERMTAALLTVRRLFSAADAEGTGAVDLRAFSRLYSVLFPHAPPDRAARAFAELAERSRRPAAAGAAGAAGAGAGAAPPPPPPPDRVDLVDWCLAIRLQDMPGIAARIARHGAGEEGGGESAYGAGSGGGGSGGRGGGGAAAAAAAAAASVPPISGLAGEVAHAALDAEEVALAEAMLARVARLAERAAQRRVRLMIDAEHSYFQPAIDHTAKQLMARYNGAFVGGGGLGAAAGGDGADAASGASAGGDGGGAAGGGGSPAAPPPPPVVFNTYQLYLKDSRQRLQEDIELARRRNYRFAAKLVRGAYMVLERKRAERMGHPSPVFDTIEQTHANYDACVELLLREVRGRGAEAMLATHNARSISRACERMRALAIPRAGGGVFFGQLLGMADAASFSLGAGGYQVAKYVPYGPVRLVMPYLVRRAQENSSLLGPGVGGELRLLRREIRRRLLGF